MKDVYEYTKYFIKNGADTTPNTFDGNMKLQKLLVFADFANIIEHGELLFDEPVLAFRNGCVIEKVRLRYKNDYLALKRDSDVFEPNFTQSEYDILNLTLSIFGNATAKELSEINHTFRFWSEAYQNGMTSDGYHHKEYSIVDMSQYPEDIERMRLIINSYKETVNEATQKEIINGVTFYYDDLEMTDELIEELEKISLSADEDVYSVYMDDSRLVVY